MSFVAWEVFILRFHHSDFAARQPAEGIIGVFERFAVEFNALRTAVRVVCERRFMRAVRRLFTEGLQAAAAIVFQRRAVNQRVRGSYSICCNKMILILQSEYTSSALQIRSRIGSAGCTQFAECQC